MGGDAVGGRGLACGWWGYLLFVGCVRVVKWRGECLSRVGSGDEVAEGVAVDGRVRVLKWRREWQLIGGGRVLKGRREWQCMVV